MKKRSIISGNQQVIAIRHGRDGTLHPHSTNQVAARQLTPDSDILR
jgi:hypothetical protein